MPYARERRKKRGGGKEKWEETRGERRTKDPFHKPTKNSVRVRSIRYCDTRYASKKLNAGEESSTIELRKIKAKVRTNLSTLKISRYSEQLQSTYFQHAILKLHKELHIIIGNVIL